ncbi:hypothetical protein B0J12DRAFT_648630 [Macrophomina phaseolina]|uniref:Secreted peptide n=1 Tax=Macrophomina phaseolina TaxID=35725 RepID=A0ABQ8GLN1_9PEZI|nr:hypothetical protein B0J12DRAFT_648630 [Macrophomina phaseolina]
MSSAIVLVTVVVVALVTTLVAAASAGGSTVACGAAIWRVVLIPGLIFRFLVARVFLVGA